MVRIDPETYDAFFRENRTQYLDRALRALGDRDSAEDVVQETFIGVSNSDSWDKGNLDQYAGRVFDRTLRTAVRDQRMRRTVPYDSDLDVWKNDLVDSGPLMEYDLTETQKGLALVGPLLRKLSENQRKALLARVLDRRNYVEISGEMQITESRARFLVSEARGKMREALSEYF